MSTQPAVERQKITIPHLLAKKTQASAYYDGHGL